LPWVRETLACQLYNHTRLRLALEPMQAPMAVLKNRSGPVGARLWGSTTLLITAYLTDCCRRVDLRHARQTFFQACTTLGGDGADVLPFGGDGADAFRLRDGAETIPSICSHCVCRCAFVQCNHDGPASTGQNSGKCNCIEFELRSMCSSMLHLCRQYDCKRTTENSHASSKENGCFSRTLPGLLLLQKRWPCP
jgi:hypothetical protein